MAKGNSMVKFLEYKHPKNHCPANGSFSAVRKLAIPYHSITFCHQQNVSFITNYALRIANSFAKPKFESISSPYYNKETPTP